MKTGVVTIPLDWGKCPPWLFRRMKSLSRGIMLAIAQEFGTEEILKRLSDPVWFQSLGCVIGFDWNSSGLFTTTMGALKEGLRGLESELGIFICGGKGKTSRKCPQQIQDWGEFLHFPMEKIDRLVYTSRMAAKVDSSLIQDSFQIYAHNFIFTKSGQWDVIQQGMNEQLSKARRYHWSSSTVKDLIEEPHSGIISDIKTKPLNLTAKESSKNRNISAAMVKEEPKTFLKNLNLIQTKKSKNLILMELKNVEFHWHPVVQEKFDPHTFTKTKFFKYLTHQNQLSFSTIGSSYKDNKVWGFDLKRLQKTIFFANSQNPQNFEQLLSLKGVGPKTIRALSLVSELIYGAKPSYEDPARYSFTVGGKDGTPFFVQRGVYDKLLDVMDKGIKKSNISNQEKLEAQRRYEKIFIKAS